MAERFSDDLRSLSILVNPDVELYEYTVIRSPDNQPATIEELREYVTKESLRPIFDKVTAQIRSLGVGIEEYTTNSYLGFRYKGRQLGWLTPNRASFDIYANIIDEKSRLVDTSGARIESGNEDYSEVLEKIRNSYANLGKPS